MRKTLLVAMLSFVFANVHAQNVKLQDNKSSTLTADSVNVFYKALFKAFKVAYLHCENVDWKTVELETYRNLNQYKSFNASLTEIPNLFNRINATHCLVYRGNNRYSVTRKIIPNESYSTSWKQKYESKPSFEVKLLDGRYGYILIPGMVFFDNSAANMHKIAQPLYDQISRLKSEHEVAGWIIDLRFNTGGNATPMLLALYDFLGNQTVWTELNPDKKIIRTYRMANGSYMQKSQKMASINPSGNLLDKAKVALITGIFTGSSGEVTALAFKGRPGSIFIGENTAGFTTSNMSIPLPFDSTLALTIGFDGDRNGVYYPRISPDIVVSKQDNFEDLMNDFNIQEAINFINSEG